MTIRRNNRTLKVLPTMRPTKRTVATAVDVCLPTIHWTPDLIDHVATLLASALVRDLLDRPPEAQKKAS